MTYDVLIVKNKENGYTAQALAWPACVVQAATRNEALAQIREALQTLWAKGEVVQIEVEPSVRKPGNPWIDNFGRFKDDPTFDDLLAEIESYRRELDAARESA